MAESTLSGKYQDLQAAIGDFAGWGRGLLFGDVPWSMQQINRIDDCVRSGLRRVYWPVPTDQVQAGYEWSFMKPLITAPLPQNAQTVQLPDDYVAMSGSKITLAPSGTTSQPYEIQWTNEGKIRELYSISPTLTGPPMYVSILSIPGVSVSAGQRFQLYFFPAADQAYTLQMVVSIAPNFLDASVPYTYGGAQHYETFLESCLAVFEERYDDQPMGMGPHGTAFQQRLLASIAMDRRNKPSRIGYNQDSSDSRHYGYPNPWWHWAAPPATYNGMSMD